MGMPEKGFCKSYAVTEYYTLDPEVMKTLDAPKWLPGAKNMDSIRVQINLNSNQSTEVNEWLKTPSNAKYILQKTREVICVTPNGEKYRSRRSTRFQQGTATDRYYSYLATDKENRIIEPEVEEGYPAEFETPGQKEAREYGRDQEKYAGRSPNDMDREMVKKQEKDLKDKMAMVKEGLKTQLYIAGLDMAAIVDPTPISDALSCAASLKEGDKAGAALSCPATVPGADVVLKPLKIVYNIKKFKKLIKKLKELMKKLCTMECKKRKLEHMRDKTQSSINRPASKIMNKDLL